MATLGLLLVSEGLSVDQTTNQISLFNVIEQVGSEGFPFLIPQLFVTAVWEPEPADELNDWQMTTTIRRPGGAEQVFPTNFRFSPGVRHRVMQRLVGLSVDRSGSLEFVIRLNQEVRGTYKVDVLQNGARA